MTWLAKRNNKTELDSTHNHHHLNPELSGHRRMRWFRRNSSDRTLEDGPQLLRLTSLTRRTADNDNNTAHNAPPVSQAQPPVQSTTSSASTIRNGGGGGGDNTYMFQRGRPPLSSSSVRNGEFDFFILQITK